MSTKALTLHLLLLHYKFPEVHVTVLHVVIDTQLSKLISDA